MVLRENLVKLRKFHSLNQEELSRAIGIKRSNLAAYEQGRCEPNICTVVKIAKYFRVSVDDLLNKEMFLTTEVRFKEVL